MIRRGSLANAGSLLKVAVVLLCAGCGQRAPSLLPVARLQGTVTLGGLALPADAEGVITFMPSVGSGQAHPTSARIVDGKYHADDVPLGNVTVLLKITRLTGRMVVEDNAPGGTPYPEREILVPEPLRQGIPLEVTGDNSRQDFDLSPRWQGPLR